MGKYLKRPSRPAAITVSAIALLLGATAYAFVSLNKDATSADAGSPPSPSLPPSSAQPSGNTQNFASSSPAATGCSHPVSLHRASGAWMADFNDDKQNTSAIPDGAEKLGLLDFDWLTFTTPGTLTRSDPFAQPLSTVLQA